MCSIGPSVACSSAKQLNGTNHSKLAINPSQADAVKAVHNETQASRRQKDAYDAVVYEHLERLCRSVQFLNAHHYWLIDEFNQHYNERSPIRF